MEQTSIDPKSIENLIEKSIQNEGTKFSASGALVTETGAHTGRSAGRRFIVKNQESESSVDWNDINKAYDSQAAAEIFSKLEKHLEGHSEKIQLDAFAGPIPIELTSYSNWHGMFFLNMFRDNPGPRLGDEIDFKVKVFHAPKTQLSELGFNEDCPLILLDFQEKKIAIIGTQYAGEIKKAVFTLCNYYFPEQGIFPMHSSANCDLQEENSCVFFGLSGTGKTTLSTSADRRMIGDDEIMWCDEGLSNLEGGCYAKLINLDAQRERSIFQAVNRFGAIQENVSFYEDSRNVNFNNNEKTENTRGSYPLRFLENLSQQNRCITHPKNIVFLTADAFGALPAVAKLNPAQAQYHFVSGYTAKVAGTEIGVKEPQAVFSACFGAPFMPRAPGVYAKLLAEKIEKFSAQVWILNTGWTQGGYGHGPRFPLPVSRKILSQIFNGELNRQDFVKHPVFNFEVPQSCPGIDSQWLEIPEGPQVQHLAQLFQANFEKLKNSVPEEVWKFGGPNS